MKTVAYPYDVLPRLVLPATFRVSGLSVRCWPSWPPPTDRSPCERCPKSTRCTPAIGWGPQTDYHQLVVLLDQLHYDKQDRPFMHSRSYFIQGLFTFTVLLST